MTMFALACFVVGLGVALFVVRLGVQQSWLNARAARAFSTPHAPLPEGIHKTSLSTIRGDLPSDSWDGSGDPCLVGNLCASRSPEYANEAA